MQKILITGGAGFIGSNLSLALIARGYEVTVLDCLSPQIHGADPEKSPLYQAVRDKVRFIHGSVTCRKDLQLALADNQIVVHLAAETGTGQSMYQIEKYVNVNVNGTAILLDILTNEKHDVKKVVVASSRAVYGEGKYRSKEFGVVYPKHRLPEDMEAGDFDVKYPGCLFPLELMPTDEASLLHPSSVYGITKLNQEQLVMAVCKAIGIPAVALRYQNVYGPGQSLSNPYTGILSIFSTQIKNGNTLNIFEDGKESRDFVFIDDVVNATILAAGNKSADGEIFNVGSGVATDVLTVAQTLLRYYGGDSNIMITGNYRVGDIRHNYADLTKITQRLGYLPQITFEEGIKQFVDWVNDQEVQDDRYLESIEEMKERGLWK